jgi:proteasome lid subunit RPN8/RPN11
MPREAVVILLKAEAERRVREAGEGAFPNECCGFLLGGFSPGGEKQADTVLAVENTREAGEQYHRFVISAEDFMRAEIEARRLKLEIVGIYHSHPDHPARPSDYDREHALPFYSYLILAVKAGKAEELTSWELNDDRTKFMEEGITLWQ